MAIDPRRLTVGELARLLNSTPIGEVVAPRHIQRHQTRAGFGIAAKGDPTRVDIFRYAAWLVGVRRQKPAVAPAAPGSEQQARAPAVSLEEQRAIHARSKRNARARGRGVWAKVAGIALRPTQFIPVDEWADKNRVLTEDQSEWSGRWRTEMTPYLRGVMRAWSDPSVETVTFMKGSQVGGTEVAINCILWSIDVDPGPLLLVYPNAELAADVNRDRILPSIRACPALKSRLKSKARDQKTYQVNFDRMRIRLVGSNSETNLASRPCKYVIFDEIDAPEFEPRALKLGKERTKAYARHKVFQNSKPGREKEGVHGQYLESDQRTYHVPCPHPACGKYQRLEFRQIKWEGGLEAKPDVVEREAWYECAHCGGRIDNHHKLLMLQRGTWVKKGEWVAIGADGIPVIRGEGRKTSHAGFQISSIYSTKLTFGYVAAKFIEGGGATQDWVNGELGEAWAPPGDKAELDELKSLCTPLADGGYLLARRRLTAGDLSLGANDSRVPDGVIVLLGAVDLQRDRAYVEVRGFGPHARDSWLVWYDVVTCPVDDPAAFEVLDRLVGREGDRQFVHADGMPIRVGAWAIDSGDGQRTHDVYAWTNQYPHVFASKGRTGTGWDDLVDLKLIDFNREARAGKPWVSGKAKLLTVNTDRYKATVLGRIKQGRALAGAPAEHREQLEGAASRGGRMRFAADTGDGYLLQLTAEHMVREVPRTGRNQGRPTLVWRLRPGRTDNHFFDTAVLTHALADAQNVPATSRVDFDRARAQIRARLEGHAAVRIRDAQKTPVEPRMSGPIAHESQLGW